MSTWINYLVPQWVDSRGGTSEPFCSLAPQTPLVLTPYNALLAAMQNVSACKVQAAIFQSAALYSGSLGSSDYPLVTDQLRLQVRSSSFIGFLTIPGPVDDIFLSDTVTLDLTDSRVVALNAQIVAVLGDKAGHAWTGIVAGQRRVVQQGAGSKIY